MHLFKIALLTVISVLFLGLTGRAQDKGLLNGTIIITLTSQDTIWVGADSRTSALTEKGYTPNKAGMCKIHSTNDVVYAMAGHVRYVDNSFDFLEMMRKCISQEDSFDKSMDLFQDRAKQEIRSILKKFSRRSIKTLIQTNNGSFLTVIAISFVEGEKKVREMRFSVETGDNNNWNVSLKVAPGNGVGSLRFIGHATNASKHVRNNNLFFGNGRNIPDKINELIRLESESSITVGLPADVISIYNNGYKRVISSGLCN